MTRAIAVTLAQCLARRMDVDARIWRLGEKQRGHVTGAQTRAEGLSAKQLHHRRHRGGWVEVLPDVFRLPGVPETEEGTLMAIQLWMGTDGHFCGSTAAYLYGLDGMEKPEPFEVARYSGASHPMVRTYRLEASDRPPTRSLNGLRVVRVERALAEMPGSRLPRIVGLALDDALRKRLTTIDRMKVQLETWRGRRGSKALRTLLRGRDANDQKVRTIFETRMLRILRRIEGYRLEPDHPVTVKGSRFRLDFFLPQVALGIECHSFRWHAGTDALRSDAKRHRLLRSVGLEILYFTWDEVVFEPEVVEAEIRAAIARRELELRGNAAPA